MNQHSNASVPGLHSSCPLFKTDLEDLNVGRSVRAVAAPVSDDVLEPLDVRLGIAVDLTVELHVRAHHCCGVCRQSSLKDRPVWRTLCSRRKEGMSDQCWLDLYRKV